MPFCKCFDVHWPPVAPAEQVVEGLGCWDDVEGRRHGAALLEVGDPQLGPRELPLRVRLLLGTGHVRAVAGLGHLNIYPNYGFFNDCYVIQIKIWEVMQK